MAITTNNGKNAEAWTQQALSLSDAGLSVEQIAAQLGKPQASVEAWLNSPGAQTARTSLLVNEHGTLSGAVNALIRQNVIPVTLNLVEIARTGSSPQALRAIELVLQRALGKPEGGINLDFGSSNGTADALDQLANFFTQNPGLWDKLSQRLGSRGGEPAERPHSPSGSPDNVIPIRDATATTSGGVRVVPSTPAKNA